MLSAKEFAEIDLRALADLNGPERAFVSLYLSGPTALNSLERRIRKVRALLAANPVELEHFDNSMELIHQHLEDEPLTEGGRCIFAAWALDYVRGYTLTVPVRDLLWVDAAPYLRPLAELQDEHESFVVVAADNTAARIFLVTSATPTYDEKVQGDVKNHVKKGGWSQQRYERRRDKELHEYAKEILDRLTQMEQEEPFDRLVLVGSDETMQAIEEILPQAMAEKFVGKKPIELDLDDDSVWKRALDLYEEAERASEEELWDRIRGEYLRGGLAVAGAEEVLQAAAVGRVEKMIVTRDVKISGTRCRSCNNVFEGTPEQCPICESDDVFTEDLVNELVELLAQTSAEAEFVDPIPSLTELGDVAALLRY